MSKFPQSPSFTGLNTPTRFEADVFDLEVEGEIPSHLDGAFYRVQPDPQFPPRLGDDIAFNGDGQVTMFRFRDGRVDMKHRWVRTDKWQLEHEAGKALFGAYRNPLTDDESVQGKIRGTANTNVLMHGGRLYALKEDSPAIVMDPNTLETIGYTDFDGRMTGETFTAHPKIDPDTGDMIAFGYAAKGVCTRDIVYYEVDPEGALKREIWFELPYYCMMHDFGLTRDYAVFHVVPIIGSWERLRAGLPHFGFDTTLPVYLGVLPRREGASAADIRWFKAPNLFASHVMNAHNDGTKIHFDTPEAAGNMFPFFPDVHGAPFDPIKAASHLTRWTVDMASNSDEFESRERLSEMVGEFPRIDDRYAGRKYRHGWMLVVDRSKPVELQRSERRRPADEHAGPCRPRDRRGPELVGRARSPRCRSPASSRARPTRRKATAISSRSPTASPRGAPTCCCSRRWRSRRARSRPSSCRCACAWACTATGRRASGSRRRREDREAVAA